MVECDLAKVEVAGSNPVSRSNRTQKHFQGLKGLQKPCGHFSYGHVLRSKELPSQPVPATIQGADTIMVAMAEAALSNRELSARSGKRLEYFTVGWNTIEGIVAVISGALAGSISLVGFGIDSFIEVISGAALLWRMSVDANEAERERNERTALRIVGACFVALSVYIAYESSSDLLARRSPERSIPGIILATASLIVMPLLSRAKRRVGGSLGSAAMHADAKQTEFCTYLSAILLGGLVLNAALGLWWADPLAALLMAPIILREGVQGMRARTCCA